jgi:hypothetical protein
MTDIAKYVPFIKNQNLSIRYDFLSFIEENKQLTLFVLVQDLFVAIWMT